MRIPLLDEDRSVAKGRSSSARRRWPHAQIKVTVATLDLKKEQQREKREKRREKRDGSVPEGRDGREKGRALGETREERKEKREERDNHNQDERAEEGNSSVPEWCRKGSRLLGAESMA